MRRQSSEYYRTLAEAIKTEAPAILHDLLQRDLSNFDPKSSPPMIAAKSRLLYDSMPETEKSLQEFVGEGNAPFNRDIILRRCMYNLPKKSVITRKAVALKFSFSLYERGAM